MVGRRGSGAGSREPRLGAAAGGRVGDGQQTAAASLGADRLGCSCTVGWPGKKGDGDRWRGRQCVGCGGGR